MSEDTMGDHRMGKNNIETSTDNEVLAKIAQAYAINIEKQNNLDIYRFLTEGRKHGFPTCCSIEDRDPHELIHWAARLLVSVTDSWPVEDLPEILNPERDTELYKDAHLLISVAMGNNRQLGEISG
jgi:hypothetical protein